MDEYREQKQGGIPCCNKRCEFYDRCFDQDCGAERNGGPAVPECKKYLPVGEKGF